MTTTDDERLIGYLRAAMAEQVRGHHLDHGSAVAAALHPARGRRPKRVFFAAVAAGIVVVAAVAVGYVVSRPDSNHSTTVPASGTCAVQIGVLPQWARNGFSDPRPVMPYVLSEHGDIIAILWSRDHPLNAPPLRDQNNKILWVTPKLGTPLVIHAHRGGTSVTRTVADGPGPSIVDMPSAGCWTFDLSWGDQHDTMLLPYRAP